MDEKRYWLRGGLKASIIPLIFVIIYGLTFMLNFLNAPNSIIQLLFILLYVSTILLIPLFIFPFSKEILIINREGLPPFPSVLGIFTIFILWFVIGAIIGFIYGKIKNRGNK